MVGTGPEDEPITLGGGTPSIALAGGSGVWVWDDQGRRYLDCTSQGWALYLGHAAPEIREHATRVMERLWHTHQGFPTAERREFAERLLSLAGDTYDKVALAPTGALAIEAAMKLTLVNRPDRSLWGRLRGGFHGTTLGVSNASWPAQDDVPESRRSLARYSALSPPFTTLETPDCFRCPFNRNRGSWSDSATCRSECADVLDTQLDQVGDRLAAILIEPVQGSGGQRILPTAWLRRLRDRAERDGFLVIYDEIQTYCRAGRYFTEPEDLRPHFIVLGKGLGGGFACGAVLIRRDLTGFPPGVHNLHTFSSSALAHSVAVKVIDIIERDRLLAAAVDRGAQLRAGLTALAERHPELADVRQIGLHVGIEFAEPEGERRPLPEFAAAVRREAAAGGLLLGVGGYKPEVVKIKPPLTITSHEVDAVLHRLADALDTASQGASEARR